MAETPLRVPWPQVRRSSSRSSPQCGSTSFLLVALVLVAMTTVIAAETIDEALAMLSCYDPTSKSCSCTSIDLSMQGLTGILPSDLGLCTDLDKLCVHPCLAGPLFASVLLHCKPTPRHAPRPHLILPPRRSYPLSHAIRVRSHADPSPSSAAPLWVPPVRFRAGVGIWMKTVSMARCPPSTAR